MSLSRIIFIVLSLTLIWKIGPALDAGNPATAKEIFIIFLAGAVFLAGVWSNSRSVSYSKVRSRINFAEVPSRGEKDVTLTLKVRLLNGRIISVEPE